ncbi:TlpA family protein disulfide reductase [Streptosporangium sp. CA-135522]|uniref:TlpA family protein disulfide reductase n=1 Tax=Streptosporangium sp. CA-135522 TaxID=3240072 RepID=UPI003D8F33CA
MPFLVAAVVLVGVLCVLNLVLTVAVIRRLREHTVKLAEGMPTRPKMIEAGTELPAFDATALDGTGVSKEFFTGPTVVGVFSTSCAACHERMPEFTGYVAGMGTDQVLAVVVQDREGDAGFDAELSAVATVVHEPAGGPVSKALQVSMFPGFYLVDGDGVVVAAVGSPADLPLPARS